MPADVQEFRYARSIIAAKGLSGEVDAVIAQLCNAWQNGTQSVVVQKKILKSFGWKTEFAIGMKTINMKNRKYAFDGYKDGLALEVEWSTTETIMGNMLKFQFGFINGLVDVAVATTIRYRGTTKSPIPVQDQGGAGEIREMAKIITVPVLLAVFTK